MNNISRRDFLKQGAWVALAISVVGYTDVLADEGPSCPATTDDILGPFYRPKAPLRKDLRVAGDEGQVLIVGGIVYGTDCKTPLKNIIVEVWQANPVGAYDNESNEYRYRSSLQTDEKGRYSFTTLMPGRYLNGDEYRPSHIHFRIRGIGYKEIVSQIYFKEDPYIAKDPWASAPKAAERILPLIDHKEGKEVVFNIVMAKV